MSTQATDARPSFILIRPPAEIAKEEKSKDLSLLMRVWPFAKTYWLYFVVTLILIPISTWFSLWQPQLLRRAIDASIVQKSSSVLQHVVMLYAIALLVEYSAKFAQTFALQYAGQKTVADIRLAVYRKLARLPMAYFDRTPSGRIVTRVANDTDSIAELFVSGAVLAVADVLTLVGIIYCLLEIDVMLTFIALGALPLVVFVVNRLRRKARESFRAIRVAVAQLNAYMSEQVGGIAVVEAFGRQKDCQREYEEINENHRSSNYLSIRYDALLYSVVESISVVTIALVLWYAAARLTGMPLEASAPYVGAVVAFYDYLQRFFVPVRELSQKYTILQASLAASERVFGLLDEAEDPLRARLQATPDIQATVLPKASAQGTLQLVAPTVRFDAVGFEYREGNPVLHDVSFEVKGGTTTALVGPTGSGKTTVMSLLLGLYRPTSGAILIEGKRFEDFSALERQSLFSVVSQDPFVFSGSILENITAFDPHPDLERAENALRAACFYDLVERRGGMDAKVSERGANWSAGERQLLVLARALYLDRPIVLLDEATANVDSETESRIQKALQTLLAGRTGIVIAHRLSTIRHADQIVVLKRGEVLELGDHASLMEHNGFFARLQNLQEGEELEVKSSGSPQISLEKT